MTVVVLDGEGGNLSESSEDLLEEISDFVIGALGETREVLQEEVLPVLGSLSSGLEGLDDDLLLSNLGAVELSDRLVGGLFVGVLDVSVTKRCRGRGLGVGNLHGVDGSALLEDVLELSRSDAGVDVSDVDVRLGIDEISGRSLPHDSDGPRGTEDLLVV